MSKHTLYIVPTPIGNLEDITIRALRVLKEVTLIAAEDTRHSRILLNKYNITTHMTSYHEHNKLDKLDMIFGALDAGDVALISDAGTPTISDPGYELIQVALSKGVTVVPLPGPNAITTALSASGLPTNTFLFLGFVPRKTQQLRDLLVSIANRRETIIFYESPNRIVKTLEVIQNVFGDRRIVIGCDLTKYFEEFIRALISKSISILSEKPARGELTLLIEGNLDPAQEVWDETRVKQALAKYLNSGIRRSEAAKIIANESGWSRRTIYEMIL